VRIELQFDDRVLFARMQKGQRRLAFAAVNAINAAARDVQAAQFENVRRKFTIRDPRFFFGTPERPGGSAARIRTFASVGKGRAFAEVEVSGPLSRGRSARRTLLPEFERGGRRGPFTPGAQTVAVPLTGGAARPSIGDKIAKEFTFGGMQLRGFRGGKFVRRNKASKSAVVSLFGTEGRVEDPTGRRRGEGLQFRGRQRTFIIPPDASFTFPQGGVFRRTGEDDIELVYVFKRPFQLDTRLGFKALGLAVGEAQLARHFEAETREAVEREGIAAIGRPIA